MSLKFLSKKRFNPSNHANIKKVWIAEQKMQEFKKREEERAKELAKERARMEEIALLGKSIDQQQLEFMYKPPPGLEEIEEKLKYEQKTKQISAPVEGDYVRNLEDVVHKPFGVEVRHVRCARCGQKGHISGDRECPLIDFNPQDGFHKRVEDPLYHMKFKDNNEDDETFIAESNLRLKESLRRNIEGIKSNLIDMENDPEQEFIDSLSKKEKKKLLKYLLKKEKKEKKKLSKKNDESKKRKRSESKEKSESKRSKREKD